MIAGNWFKTGLLMAAIMALFGVVGAMLGGGQGMMLASNGAGGAAPDPEQMAGRQARRLGRLL